MNIIGLVSISAATNTSDLPASTTSASYYVHLCHEPELRFSQSCCFYMYYHTFTILMQTRQM